MIKRVVIAADFSEPWSFCRFVQRGLEENGLDVKGFDALSSASPFIDLMSLLDRFKPDLLLHMKDRNFHAEWLQEAAKKGIITAEWYPDIALPEWLVPYINNVNVFFTMAEGMIGEFRRYNPNVFWLSQAFDDSFFRVKEVTAADGKTFASDVTFIGTLGSKEYYLRRRRYLQRVISEGIRFTWWGPRLPRKLSTIPLLFGKLGRAYGGRFVWGEDYAKVAQLSKVFLAFDAEPGIRKSMSARMYTAVGCGAFYLCEHVDGIEDVLTPGREIITFRSEGEMIEKIRYFLKHEGERLRISEAGRTRVLRDHTYKIRTRKMLSIIEDVMHHG